MEKSWSLSTRWTSKHLVQLTAAFFCLLSALMMVRPTDAAHEAGVQTWSAVYDIQESGQVRADIRIDFEKLFSHAIQVASPRPFVHAVGRVDITDIVVLDAQENPVPEQHLSWSAVLDQHLIRIEPGESIDRQALRIQYTILNSIATDETTKMDKWSWIMIPRYELGDIHDLRIEVRLPEAYDPPQLTTEAVWSTATTYKEGVIHLQAADVIQGNELHTTIEWPTGAVVLPEQSPWFTAWLVLKYPYYALPVITLFVLFSWFWRFGRDPGTEESADPIFEPPYDLGPASLGSLVHERVRIQYIGAILVNLAQRGYIQIIEEPRESVFRRKEYTFIKSIDFESDERLIPIETYFLRSLFADPRPEESRKASVKLSELKNSFALHITEIRQRIMNSLVERRYFREDPTEARSRFFIIATVLAATAIITTIIVGVLFYFWSAAVPLFLMSGLVVSFAPLMPQKTGKGARAAQLAVGFRKYLKHPERFLTTARTPEVFSRFLPYAMVLDVEKHWAKGFEGILQELPEWYIVSGDVDKFSPTEFTHSLRETFIHAASQTLEHAKNDPITWPGAMRSGKGYRKLIAKLGKKLYNPSQNKDND